ncbi:inositol polyphosphate 5-phosphatase K isoform X2 [Lingula anatina]|uniref:Inositol polyphosphate 5-phosphatase K isoform X1 n=1 Tax=Lingula anatina TaxID=7574 RepID=A0A1S3J1J3_LINAN|nr:inositol polyphosphate 5-phosphatase K isoform X1 [Lingula anatina]XP_013403694.1 inositol polyphosphate 5-phosphatase K isoform X2 [Lingula anatina]|eukprot:XP_013403693.1 inositol polyphosphate 5-phosphatase K isoform X1 [Lingula anatina]
MTNFRIYLCTWNVGNKFPLKKFDNLLGFDSPNLPDVYAIGLQEVKGGTASIVTSYVMDDPWTSKLTKILNGQGYVRIKGVRLQGLVLTVFCKRHHLPFMTNIESEYTRSGLGGWWGNKGGVSIRFDAYGVNVCIVNSHLAAHLEAVAERIEDYSIIVESQQFREKETPSILDHDYIFWMGDLNFRIDDIPRDDIIRMIKNKDLESLWSHDQLTKARQEELILVDFEEGPLTFPPSYKFDPGTDHYDTSSKHRKPAWCDRILWLVHEDSFEGFQLAARQEHYTSHSEYKLSDHKPVTSVFNVKLLNITRPAIQFAPIFSWSKDGSATCVYSVDMGVKTSSWDWIGLYKANFKHLYDYVTYVYAPAPHGEHTAVVSRTVKFKKSSLRCSPGSYCLCYINGDKMFVRGMSNVFKIIDADSSSEDSSSPSSSSYGGDESDIDTGANNEETDI